MTFGEPATSGSATPRTISSRQTLFAKVILPALWIGTVGAGALTVSVGSLTGNLPAPLSLIFLAVWALGATMFWRLLVPLKKVGIDGVSLTVSNYRREITVPLGEIESVTENRWLNYRPVTIHLRHDTGFGRKITFMPKVRPFLLWRSHPIVAELRALADPQHQRE